MIRHKIYQGKTFLTLTALFVGLGLAGLLAPAPFASANGCYSKQNVGYVKGVNSDCKGVFIGANKQKADPTKACYATDTNGEYKLVPCNDVTASYGCYAVKGSYYIKKADSACKGAQKNPLSGGLTACYLLGEVPPAPQVNNGYAAVDCTSLNLDVLPSNDLPDQSQQNQVNFKTGSGKYRCGGKDASGVEHDVVEVSINIGCTGHGNAIADMTFAIIRFLSNGVGVVVIASMIWAGIQYTSSRGDPQATAKAVERIRSSVIALLIFLFAYAMLNYIIPDGFFR